MLILFLLSCLTCKLLLDNCTALRFKYSGIYICNKNQQNAQFLYE
jgi:hypothetical protein